MLVHGAAAENWTALSGRLVPPIGALPIVIATGPLYKLRLPNSRQSAHTQACAHL
jgi:hypothetical protein